MVGSAAANPLSGLSRKQASTRQQILATFELPSVTLGAQTTIHYSLLPAKEDVLAASIILCRTDAVSGAGFTTVNTYKISDVVSGKCSDEDITHV
jgi:hypothetical protein